MNKTATLPAFRPSALLLVCLSLSIGWGIRGNFGHEFGAMIPGALAGIAVALFSGRADWRRRVAFFAAFGAMGWAFGGSMAYMLPLGYTHSGHLPTQVYGFLTTFVTGFLWASIGGAGTAYPAVEEREKLTQLFKPLCWVLAIWTIQYVGEDAFSAWCGRVFGTTGIDHSDFRQKSPLYWLDSEWLEASTALIALCLFDLWDRRFSKLPLLGVLAAMGALGGFVIQKLLTLTGLIGPLVQIMVHCQGDPTAIDPITHLPFDPANMLTNWPQIFFDLAPHLGWLFGLVAGIGLYFYRYGQWRSGSSLLMHIAMGSYLAFLIGPVFLSNFMMGVGGCRLVAPRGDSWANTLGALVGILVYAYRYRLMPVAFAAVVSGVIGGLGLMVAQCVKLLAFMPGNPVITQDQTTVAAWAHWRSANWHSICTEQGAGILYGLGIAVAMGMLSSRLRPVDDEPPVRRWTEAFSVSFVLNLILFVNLVKVLEDWTREQAGGFRSVPLTMKAPWFPSIEFSATGWFTLVFALMTLCTIALLAAHLRRPLAVVPSSWLGKGQMLYLVLLWGIVLGNLMKAVVAFSEQRLATEGVITVNALIATFVILFYARDHDDVAIRPLEHYGTPIRKTITAGLLLVLLFTAAFTAIVRGVYGNKPDGWGTPNVRFGADADWRKKPILKNKQHR